MLSGNYRFCSVVFQNHGKSYYYLSDDEKISIGDLVIVPVGGDYHEEVAKVINIEYFSRKNAPFPVERTKSVIRKCSYDEAQKLAELGIEGDWEGIGHCILGVPDGDLFVATERQADRVYWVR